MKALALSDKVIDFIYSPAIRERFADIDMVFGCGDLPYYYLEYVVSMLDKPLYFVRGNHAHTVEHGPGGPRTRPWGATDLDRRAIHENGLLIAGFEGSIRYNSGPFQYTDEEMFWRISQVIPRLILNRAIYGRYLDILIAHSPPFQVGDDTDRCHTGFKAFRRFLQWFKPRLMLHGHIHVYHPSTKTELHFGETLVMNCYGYRVLELVPGPEVLPRKKRQVRNDRGTEPGGLRPGYTKGLLEPDQELAHRAEQ